MSEKCLVCGEDVSGPGNEICSAPHTASSFAAPPGSAAPTWYTPEEMWHWLRRQRYNPSIADELSEQYAANLQKAFNKGFELGQREAARQNDKLSGAEKGEL